MVSVQERTKRIGRLFLIASTFTFLFYLTWIVFASRMPVPIQGLIMVSAAFFVAFGASRAVHGPFGKAFGIQPPVKKPGWLVNAIGIIVLVMMFVGPFLILRFVYS